MNQNKPNLTRSGRMTVEAEVEEKAGGRGHEIAMNEAFMQELYFDAYFS